MPYNSFLNFISHPHLVHVRIKMSLSYDIMLIVVVVLLHYYLKLYCISRMICNVCPIITPSLHLLLR